MIDGSVHYLAAYRQAYRDAYNVTGNITNSAIFETEVVTRPYLLLNLFSQVSAIFTMRFADDVNYAQLRKDLLSESTWEERVSLVVKHVCASFNNISPDAVIWAVNALRTKFLCADQ